VEVSTQFAFLRGVNVGGRNKVPMAALRAMLEGLGFGDVRTLLQSGNAVYTTDRAPERAAREIHEQIEERLGLSIAVLVRTHDELASVVAGDTSSRSSRANRIRNGSARSTRTAPSPTRSPPGSASCTCGARTASARRRTATRSGRSSSG
jgi:hypothetical protein